MSKLWEISWNLDENPPCYSGDREVSIIPKRSDEGWEISNIEFTSHSGTHVDFPKHFVQNGKKSNLFSLNSFIGAVRLLEIPADTGINAEFLRNKNILEDMVIFKTNRDLKTFLTSDGANYLIEKGILLVGTDSLSIDGSEPTFSAHKALLGSGILIVENLFLEEVTCGSYNLICLPLPFADADGSPCRAILVSTDYWSEFARVHKV